MKVKNKKLEKLKERMIRMEKIKTGDGDELINNPFKKEIGSVLSLGKSKDIKSLTQSSKKRIGNIVNKNIDNRYNSVEKTLERMRKLKEKKL